MTKITIFTPTYNRVEKIHRLMDSIVGQKFKNFEWIIVDNGEDDVSSLIIDFKIKHPEIAVIYVKQGRGLHKAINTGIKMSNSPLFYRVDDDDTLAPNALSEIIKMEQTISEKEKFAGVAGLKFFYNGKVVGNEWAHPLNYIDATNLERHKYGLDGDKAEVYYTNVLRKFYPLPEVNGEYGGFEGILWNRIASNGYKIRWFNKCIYYCAYEPDGLTTNSKKVKIENLTLYCIYVSELIKYKEVTKLIKIKCLCRFFESIHEASAKAIDYYQYFDISKFILFVTEFMSYLTKYL